MEVRSFKLISGQELIAGLLHETGTGYLVKDPLVVHVMRGPSGEGQLAFAEWSMIHRDREIELLDGALAARPARVLDDVEKSYLEQTTGVALPEAGKILMG